MYLGNTNVNSSPAPIFVKPIKPTIEMVKGAYTVSPISCRNFTFVLLPNGIYRGHFGHFDNSEGQDWSGKWKLDAANCRIDVKEWPESSSWYGDDSQAGKWYIYLRFDRKGKVIREGYICRYGTGSR